MQLEMHSSILSSSKAVFFLLLTLLYSAITQEVLCPSGGSFKQWYNTDEEMLERKKKNREGSER